jgi:hypothetical protein
MANEGIEELDWVVSGHALLNTRFCTEVLTLLLPDFGTPKTGNKTLSSSPSTLPRARALVYWKIE